MLRLVESYDPAKTYLGIFWRVIMFGSYTGLQTRSTVHITNRKQLPRRLLQMLVQIEHTLQ